MLRSSIDEEEGAMEEVEADEEEEEEEEAEEEVQNEEEGEGGMWEEEGNKRACLPYAQQQQQQEEVEAFFLALWRPTADEKEAVAVKENYIAGPGEGLSCVGGPMHVPQFDDASMQNIFDE